MKRRIGSRGLCALTALGLLVAACGSDDSASGTTEPAATEPSATGPAATDPAATDPATTGDGEGARTAYPVEVTDCQGRVSTYDHAPERIVTFDHNVAETLISLGLADRIVGLTLFESDEDLWEPTKEAMSSLEILNPDRSNYPSKEAVVAVEPDFVTSIYPSALLEPGDLPNRDEWADLGVASYLLQTGCDPVTSATTDFSSLYEDIRNFGIIFDVQGRAEALIAEMEADIAALQVKAKEAGIEPVTVWTYGGEDDAWAFDGNGILNAIMSLAGVENAFSDTLEGYLQTSWEEIVARDPDVIWLTTSAGFEIDGAQAMKDQLASDPRVQNVAAVKNEAYVVTTFSDVTPSPRAIDGLRKVIDGLIALA